MNRRGFSAFWSRRERTHNYITDKILLYAQREVQDPILFHSLTHRIRRRVRWSLLPADADATPLRFRCRDRNFAFPSLWECATYGMEGRLGFLTAKKFRTVSNTQIQRGVNLFELFAKHQPGVAGCGWLQPGRNFLST